MEVGDMNKQTPDRWSMALWFGAGALMLVLLFTRLVYPEHIWLSLILVVLLIPIFFILIQQNHRALKSRTMAFGLNSLITALLVIGIVGVLNFLSARYPFKLDLT